MRPHLLEFTAIGSYPGTVHVDFDALAPQGLFHIHGPTGAGKSSLIDAMCFALYGTIPGPRLADGLRSHHADPKVEAVVRLTFSAQGTTWKIIRTPAQTRAKLRGEGTTHQYATASLQRKEGGGWAPVASGSKEVDPIVQKLLGLDAAQFMQVVVLPQGGFQKVLRAGADEREKLLRHLFGTQRFDHYTQQLKERADAYKLRVDAQQGSLRHTALRIHSALAAFDAPVDGFPDVIDEVTLRAVRDAAHIVREQTTQANADVDRLAKIAEKADVKLRREFKQWDRWQRRIGAESRIASLEQERDDIEALQHELDNAERAAPLAPLFTAVQDAQHAFLTATATRQAAQSAIRSALHGVITTEESICADLASLADSVPSPSRLDAVRKTVRARATDVHVAADQARQALHARADVEHFESRLPVLAHRMQKLTDSIDALTSERESLSAALIDIRRIAEQANAVSEHIRSLENRLAAAESLSNERNRTQQIQHQLEAAKLAEMSARRQHLELVERRIQAMAGELAKELVDGEPCAVCGATEHPAPASFADIVKREDIAAAEQRTDEAHAAVVAVEAQCTDALEREATWTAAAGDVLDDLTEATSTLNDLRLQLAVSQNAADQLTRNLERLDVLGRQVSEAEHTRASLNTEHITALSRLDEAKRRLDELETRMGAGSSEHVIELAGALEAAHESIDVLANSIDEERLRAETMEEARNRLAENAEASGVADVGDALAYLRNDQQLRVLRQRVQQWQVALANAQATLDEPTVAAMTTEPDTKAAEHALQLAQTEHKEAIGRAARFAAQSQQLDNMVDDLTAEFEQFQPLLEEYERVRTLADICHGRGNTRKQSLERYILASYLEEVAEAAGKRLLVMSAGRYSLRHSDARVRGNGASGLALLVTDAYTGQEREVSTLSGGETFLASLALALGLADTVQAKSGGVHIDALFIDEGFGSLDPEALELAMSELDRLREGGRLVGVISHVATLRERIPAGIEVIAGPSGSTIRQSNASIVLV